MFVKDISDELQKGRRALDSIKEVSIVTDWQWDDYSEKWYLEVIIYNDSIENEEEIVPVKSLWYVVVDGSYPKGKIKVYPSVKSGFDDTLYHQSNNGKISENKLWRVGGLCLDSYISDLQKLGYKDEPCTVDERLHWHVQRAVNWITCANSRKLINPLDPFELPDFNERGSAILAFNEDKVSFMQWECVDYSYGYVDLISNEINPLVYATSVFRNSVNKEVMPIKWGDFFSDDAKSKINVTKGIWILLNSIPVVKLWQAPNTFKELVDACNKCDFNLMAILEILAHRIRDGKGHSLLVGFPISETFSGEKSMIYWKALKLPVLSHGKYTQNGYRQKENGYWLRDKLSILKHNIELNWVVTQNWSANEINNRGKMIKSLESMNALIIGAGSIGASVAETLTRAGVYKIHIQDYDILEIGNLSRHSLDLSNVGKPKAEELVEYLHRINPHSIARSINEKFLEDDKKIESLEKYDLIIDCTGEDSVLFGLSKMKFKSIKIFASVSIGFAAERLYIFLQKSNSLNNTNFFLKVLPFLDTEQEKFKDFEFPRDGVGCWSPLFPARQDDISIASSTFIKVMEEFIKRDDLKEIVKIYEQFSSKDGFFAGYREADKIYE